MKQYVEVKGLIALGLYLGLLLLWVYYGSMSWLVLALFVFAIFVISWWIGDNTLLRQFQRLMKRVAGDYDYLIVGNSADVMIFPYEFDGDKVETEGLTVHYQLVQPKYNWLLSTTADVEVSFSRMLPADAPHNEAIDNIVERMNTALGNTDIRQLDASAVTHTIDTESLRIAILIPGQYATSTRLRSLQNALIAAFAEGKI